MTDKQNKTDDEMVDAEQRATKIASLMKRSAEVWLEVATEVNDAKRNLSPNAFAHFLTKAGLTTAIADKMPRIATQPILYSDEAKPHISKLEGWSTLYEVAKLKQPEIREMFKALAQDKDMVLSRSIVQSFKKGGHSKVANIVVAQILVNEDDFKRLDYEQFVKFKDDLTAIHRIVDRSYPAVTYVEKETKLEELELKISDADDSDEESPTISNPNVETANTQASVSMLEI